MDGIIITTIGNGKYYYKIKTNTDIKPKHLCIEEAIANECELIIERQTNERHRMFGYYKSVDDYRNTHSLTNVHAYEVICRECKLYFDIEYKHTATTTEDFINDIKASITKHFEAFFKQELKEEHLMISCATGIGESASWKGVQKHSYHIVVNNGWFFKSNQDIKHFIKHIYDFEENEDIKKAIDKCVYGKNQSFKLPYQSKCGSERIQKVQNGKFKQHLINKYSFDAFNGHYKYTIDDTKQDKTDSSVLLSDVGKIEKDVVFDYEVDTTNLKEMLKILGNDNYDWDTFFKICCVIKNEGGDENLFHSWCKLSSKYIENETTNLWNSLHPVKNGFNIQTLTKMVTKKYPKLL